MDSHLPQVQELFLALVQNRYVQAGTTIVASYVVAKLLGWIVFGLLGRWVNRTESPIDDKLLAILQRPVVVTVVIIGLILGTLRLGFGGTPEGVTVSSLQTILVLVWLVFAIRFSRLLLSILSQYQDRFSMVQARTLPLFDNLALLALIGAAVYFLFLSWSIDVTGWLASAGIIGLAVTFAARDTLANLLAGVFILADGPYKIGDFVILDGGERGRVTRIGLRSTRLLTRDDIEITIPNAVMGNSKIINESGGPHEKERIRIRVSVAYGSNLDHIREVLIRIARSHEEICTDPEPRVRFREFGSSGLVFELLCWISEPVLRGRLMDAMNCEVYNAFLEEGIEIPYTKQDLYIKELPGSGS